ncbi:MAG: tyrosine--tRNA ligase [Actinobacteria bacterium]|nr:tyrosine--tRNA ligase [Actinomycetota bacterium]
MRDEVLKQLKEIKKGVVDLISEAELIARIQYSINKRLPMRVKLGIDPTAPDIHLGHSVILNKLRQFQDLGHIAVLIIGDYTARIGDPSGRSETRPQLSMERIDQNARTYVEQVFKILDKSRTEVRFNGEWLSTLKLEDIIKLTSKFTIARLLERDDFNKRFTENAPISLMELLYPIMQGYDSVAVMSDIELGGTEQKFNLLIGRYLQKEFNQMPQLVMTMPILVGLDGVNRMSKSLGNYVGINEGPDEIFGKIMSMPDSSMRSYFELVSSFSFDEIKSMFNEMEKNNTNPSYIKRILAKDIVTRFHSMNAAINAEKEFDRIFKQKNVPSNIEVYSIHISDINDVKNRDLIWVPRLLKEAGLAPSTSEAIRLINAGSVSIHDMAAPASGPVFISDPDLEFSMADLDGKVLKVGKRKFKKIVVIK